LIVVALAELGVIAPSALASTANKVMGRMFNIPKTLVPWRFVACAFLAFLYSHIVNGYRRAIAAPNPPVGVRVIASPWCFVDKLRTAAG